MLASKNTEIEATDWLFKNFNQFEGGFCGADNGNHLNRYGKMFQQLVSFDVCHFI